MDRDFLEIFQVKLKAHRIQAKVLAAEAGRNASYLSEVFNKKQSPTLDSFKGLIEAADRLSPGFADEYYAALMGRVDLNTLVRSLTIADVSNLLILVSNRLAESLPSRQKVAT